MKTKDSLQAIRDQGIAAIAAYRIEVAGEEDDDEEDPEGRTPAPPPNPVGRPPPGMPYGPDSRLI